MIEINPEFKCLCHICSVFEPKMDVVRHYADNELCLTTITISCDKRALCDKLENELLKNKYNKPKGAYRQ